VRALVALCLVLAVAIPAQAGIRPGPDGLANALAARDLVGPEVWSRIVRIENRVPGGLHRRTPYPKTVYALVFELSGILWFYTDADGTQSLSLRRGALDSDKADPGPLLRAISPGFASWAWVEPTPSWTDSAPRIPPNACFLECVAALRRQMNVGAETADPRLLSYYVDTPSGRLGHTVLLFRAQGRLEALDPASSPSPEVLPHELDGDDRSISRYLRGGEVADSRALALSLPRPSSEGQKLVALADCVGPDGSPRLSSGESAHQSLM
jgi:hypothetical protein